MGGGLAAGVWWALRVHVNLLGPEGSSLLQGLGNFGAGPFHIKLGARFQGTFYLYPSSLGKPALLALEDCLIVAACLWAE